MSPAPADPSPTGQVAAAPDDLHRAMVRSLELTTDLVVVIDVAGQLLWVNRWGLELLGYTPEDVCGRNFLEFVHPDDLPDAVNVLARSMDPERAHKIRTARYRVRCADGSYRALWFNGANVASEGKVVVHGRHPVDAEILDEITQAVTVGAPFDEALALVPGLGSWRFDESLHGVFYRTEDGAGVMVGDAELAVLGAVDDPASPVSVLAGQPDDRRSGPVDDLPDLAAQPLRELGVAFLATDVVVDPLDGRPCLVVSALLDDLEATITARVLVRMARATRLVLQSRERVVRLRRAADELQEFLTEVSHELRTPLTSIVGFADLYLDGAYATPGHQRRAIERIRSEGVRMMGLVEDLLLLAHLDEGRPTAARPVDLAEVVREVGMDARAAHREREIGVRAPAPVVVHGVADQLRQVVVNLVSNACRHTPGDRSVELGVALHGEVAEITVRDDGPGIPPEVRERMFDRFYSGGTSVDDGSAGLGLAIVDAIVAAHGGEVRVESRPGSGSCFSVRLPIGGVAAETASEVHQG